MRKKFIKSSRPTYKKRIKKAQQGMRFVSYNPVSNPTIDYTDITNPINPFSEYNYNTTYDKPTALVVPVRDTEETDVVANNPTVEPVINKPVASKPVTDKPVTKTANSTWKSPYTNRKQWSTELINAYKKAGITNDNAIRMLLAQDALESSWGKSAQGKYNFGNLTTGSSWKGDYVTGNDKNAKGEAIKQKFRSYNSMDEYAADKIQFLKRLYDFDENDDINKFVAKLTGSNKGKRRYAEAKEYANSLRGVYNSFKAGGIIKYQEPAQPIARRDAIKDYSGKEIAAADTCVGYAVTDSNGVASCDSKLVRGEYYYKELKTAGPQYVMDEELHPFTLILANSKISTFNVNETLPIKNVLARGNIKVLKVNKDGRAPLAGAEFDVFNADGKIVDHLVTGTDGTAMTKVLPYGKYSLRETKAPTGFVLSKATFDTEIIANGDVPLLEITNSTITKLGSTDIFVIVGLAIVFAGLLTVICFKLRRK